MSDLLIEHQEIFWSLFTVDLDAILAVQPPDTWESFQLYQLLNDYLSSDGEYSVVIVKVSQFEKNKTKLGKERVSHNQWLSSRIFFSQSLLKPTYPISSCMSRSWLWAETQKLEIFQQTPVDQKKGKTTEFSNCFLMPNLQLQTEPCFSFCLSNTEKSHWAYRWRIPYVCRQEITCMDNKGTLCDSTSVVVQSSIYLHIKSCFSFQWRPIILRPHM